MTYTALAVLAVLAVAVADRWVLRTRLLATRGFWITYAIVLFFQLIANGVLTGLRVVRYSPAAILGPRIAWAPVEDVAFGFALITLTLCCWTRLTAAPDRHGRPRGRPPALPAAADGRSASPQPAATQPPAGETAAGQAAARPTAAGLAAPGRAAGTEEAACAAPDGG